ncbi:MAG: hypothetical protein Q8900_07400 [Bacillota bacterium]|nr:hypothetical protein [Bacillota bacterium]
MDMIQDNKSNVSEQVLRFVQLYSSIWWNANSDFPSFLQETSYLHKKNQEKETDKFINQFFNTIKLFPSGEEERMKWKKNMQDILNEFLDKTDLISNKDSDIIFNGSLIQATEDFVNESKSFNPNMELEDMGQALRNNWVMNIIQIIFGKTPKVTPSIFGYSMLYPYTDNYLDDEKISKEDKYKIGNSLEKRLSGHYIEPSNSYEGNIYKLVNRIEEQYDHKTHPEVFESIICIHNAQMKSLKQQGKLCGPYEKDILGMSIEKGGTSVLADAYLVNGTLAEKEASFFFGYGFLLQICDDLQDGKKDFEECHMTIISQMYGKWHLDYITNKLFNYIYEFINNADFFKYKNADDLKSLIFKNCIQLILFSTVNNRKMYSREYFNTIKKYFPYTVPYMRKIYSKVKKKYSSLNESYNGVDVEQILLYALKK